MGNYAAKLLFHNNEAQKESSEAHVRCEQQDVEDNMCTPPLPEKRTLVDPRSASVGIYRTPIEIKYAGLSDQETPVFKSNKAPSAIPKYLQPRQYLETDMDMVMPPLTPKKCIPELMGSDQSPDSDRVEIYLTPNIDSKKSSKIFTPIDAERYSVLGLDPRSPAADFDRTPILIPKSLAKLKARSQENLTRRGSYDTDMYYPKVFRQGSACTGYSTPDIKLLPDITSQHSEILNMREHKEPNLSSMLHFDFDSSTYKNLAQSIKNMELQNPEGELISSERTIDDNEDDTYMGKQDDCEAIEHDVATMLIAEAVSPSHFKSNDDPQDHSDKIKIWQDPSSSEESESYSKVEKENVTRLIRRTSSREDVIITFDGHTGNTLANSGRAIKKKKKDRVDERSFSLNEKNVFTPGSRCSTELFKNRTPLSNRSNREERVAARSPQQLLKNKAPSSKEQQENTPPCKRYGGSARTDNHWDPNSTIFI